MQHPLITTYNDYRELVKELLHRLDEQAKEILLLRELLAEHEGQRKNIALSCLELRDFAMRAECLSTRLQNAVT